LLFHYGRSDSTVAFYGAKVSPADIQEVVYSLPELAERVTSFALLLGEDAEANKRLALAFELVAGAEPPADADGIGERVLARLAEVNQDFREAARFVPAGFEPTIEFHRADEGPFAGYDVRLKRTYIRAAER
jgi:phenylacetate-CoA ligase